MAENFCNAFMLRNRSIARSRRRNGWCEFLGSIVDPSAAYPLARIADNSHRRAIGAKPVSYDALGLAVPFHETFEQI